MALFRKSTAGTEGPQPVADGAEGLRMREQMVTRRESEALRREKALLEKQVELDRRLKDLATIAEDRARLKAQERQIVELQRQLEDLKQYKPEPRQPGQPVMPPVTARSRRIVPVKRGGPLRPGEHRPTPDSVDALDESLLPEISDGSSSLIRPVPSFDDSLIGGGSSRESTDQFDQLRQELREEQERLDELADELAQRESSLRLREAQVRLQEEYSPAPAGEGSVSGEAVGAVVEALQCRIAELEDKLAEQRIAASMVRLPADDSKDGEALQARLVDLDKRTRDLERRERGLAEKLQAQKDREQELTRQQDDLYRAKEMLEQRESDLDRREIDLMDLRSQLKELEDRINRVKNSSDSNLTVDNIEPLPPYASTMSVLKADQLRLQERLFAGGGSDEQHVVTSNVLF
jgi:chromosome segregation ATPase